MRVTRAWRGAVLLPLLAACTALSGLDDKIFDLAPTAGGGGVAGDTGGTGGFGGSAGHGGDVPVCTAEMLDLAPRVVHVQDAISGTQWVTGTPGFFGVAAVVPYNPVEEQPTRFVGAIHTDGASEREDSFNVRYDTFEAHVEAGHGLFAHVVPYSSGGQLQVRFMAPVGSAPATETIATAADPTQAHALTMDEGFLITFALGADSFSHTLVSSATWEHGPVGAFSPATVCDEGRAWAGASVGSTAAIAWQSSCSATQWELATYTAAGGMVPVAALTNTTGAPRFGGPLSTGFLFANCSRLAHVALDGQLIASATLPGTSCAIGTDGAVLRMVDVDAGSMRWRALTTDGSLTDLFTIDAAPNGAPLVAWDGSGYAIVWWENSEIMYAHVCVPS